MINGICSRTLSSIGRALSPSLTPERHSPTPLSSARNGQRENLIALIYSRPFPSLTDGSDLRPAMISQDESVAAAKHIAITYGAAPAAPIRPWSLRGPSAVFFGKRVRLSPNHGAGKTKSGGEH